METEEILTVLEAIKKQQIKANEPIIIKSTDFNKLNSLEILKHLHEEALLINYEQLGDNFSIQPNLYRNKTHPKENNTIGAPWEDQSDYLEEYYQALKNLITMSAENLSLLDTECYNIKKELEFVIGKSKEQIISLSVLFENRYYKNNNIMGFLSALQVVYRYSFSERIQDKHKGNVVINTRMLFHIINLLDNPNSKKKKQLIINESQKIIINEKIIYDKYSYEKAFLATIITEGKITVSEYRKLNKSGSKPGSIKYRINKKIYKKLALKNYLITSSGKYEFEYSINPIYLM